MHFARSATDGRLKLSMWPAVRDARSALEERDQRRAVLPKQACALHRQAHKELRAAATVHTDAR